MLISDNISEHYNLNSRWKHTLLLTRRGDLRLDSIIASSSRELRWLCSRPSLGWIDSVHTLSIWTVWAMRRSSSIRSTLSWGTSPRRKVRTIEKTREHSRISLRTGSPVKRAREKRMSLEKRRMTTMKIWRMRIHLKISPWRTSLTNHNLQSSLYRQQELSSKPIGRRLGDSSLSRVKRTTIQLMRVQMRQTTISTLKTYDWLYV